MPITSPSRKRFFWVRVFPAVAWAGVIFALSSLPGTTPLPRLPVPFADKWEHMVAYALLGALILRAGRDEWLLPPRLVRWAATSLAIGILYGVSDEWRQRFVPDRICSAYDLAADAIGVAIGVGVWWSVVHRCRTKRYP
ncbi:VanZ family protein [Candidatus Sumerlaeota bacterium]|nr:VanZ family protein [Candidatus Sumerlaeota bacterium]